MCADAAEALDAAWKVVVSEIRRVILIDLLKPIGNIEAKIF